jgi:tight adherence protein B
MFEGDAQRNVILLSDGGDTVSEGKLAEAVGAASDAGAAIFSVGLTTGEADVDALRTISDRTGGRYAPAGTADLSGVYAGLATELANQFLISYRSGSEPGAEVSLEITTPLGPDSVLVALPAAEAIQEASPVPAPRPVPRPDPLLQGTWGLRVVLGLTFLSILLLSVLVFGTGARRRRDRELARRMATQQRGRPVRERGEASRGLASLVPEPIIAVADRAARAGGFSETLNDRLERADAPFRAGEFLIGSVLAALVGALAGYGLFDSVLFALVLAVVAGAIPHLVVEVQLQRRLTRILGQLPDMLLLLSSSLRAGHSFMQALDGVSQEIGEPAAHELSRVVAEIRLGRPVDQAMNGLADRVGSEDFGWAVMAVNVQRDVGGNLAEVLDTVAETLREREVIRRQVKVLSAEGRISAWILSLLPLLLALYIFRVNPSYMEVLFTTRIGLMMLAGGGSLMVIGILWLRKLVRIDV